MNFFQRATVQFRRATNPAYRKAYDEAYAKALIRANLPEGSYDLAALFGKDGSQPTVPLGTAEWMSPAVAVQKFGIPEDALDFIKKQIARGLLPFLFGTSFDVGGERYPLGYADDRHVCLVSGTRGGKGVGIIIPTLSYWMGSCIVVDPKGENATVTASRRGHGSAYSEGMGQKVCILDPFQEVQIPGIVRAHYNPLDTIDPTSELAIDDAGRVAAALVVPQNQNDPY